MIFCVSRRWGRGEGEKGKVVTWWRGEWGVAQLVMFLIIIDVGDKIDFHGRFISVGPAFLGWTNRRWNAFMGPWFCCFWNGLWLIFNLKMCWIVDTVFSDFYCKMKTEKNKSKNHVWFDCLNGELQPNKPI